jgi:hypothetical protein
VSLEVHDHQQRSLGRMGGIRKQFAAAVHDAAWDFDQNAAEI